MEPAQREPDEESEDRQLPSAVKAGINISIHLICKFSPAVNSDFQGKNSCLTNAEDWESFVLVKKTTLLSPPGSGFAALSLCSPPLAPAGWVTPRLSVASGSTALQITAATLCLLLFLMHEWSCAILSQQVIKTLNHQMDQSSTSHAALS